MQILTIEDLSFKLRKAKASIYSDLTRNPRSLPPHFRLPNSRRILFRLSDVDDWLESLVIRYEEPKRKGRPHKSLEIMARNAKKAEAAHA